MTANLTPNPNPNLDCEGVALDGELDRLGTLREAEPVQAKARTYMSSMSSRPAWGPAWGLLVRGSRPVCGLRAQRLVDVLHLVSERHDDGGARVAAQAVLQQPRQLRVAPRYVRTLAPLYQAWGAGLRRRAQAQASGVGLRALEEPRALSAPRGGGPHRVGGPHHWLWPHLP